MGQEKLNIYAGYATGMGGRKKGERKSVNMLLNVIHFMKGKTKLIRSTQEGTYR